MASTKPPFWLVFKAHLRADPRKTAVLVLLTIGMIVVYARTFLASDVPQQAEATTHLVVNQLSPNTGDVDKAAQTDSVTCERVKLSRTLFRQLTRDPFAVDRTKFRAVWNPEALLAPENPTANQNRETGPELVLQCTISGSTPMAWISGQLVRPGDPIGPFVVERIEPKRVVLRRGSHLKVLLLKYRK